MTFLHPGWLLLLILLPFLGLAGIFVSYRRKSRWDVFVAPRLRGALIRRSSLIPRWLAVLFLLAGCAALIIALARPQGDAGVRTEKTEGRNILIALDLSRSMRADDVRPDRLAQAKIIIYELLEKLPNDRIGLIGFAGTAHSYAPLTIDHKAVAETVGQIDETWTPVGGSDLSSALKLAIETLKKTGQKNNALVILSDGEENENMRELATMAKEAESAGIHIYAIGVGTTQGSYVPNPETASGQVEEGGVPIISRLQPEVLQKLAEETRGRYVAASSGVNIPEMVQTAAKNLDSFETESRERRLVIEFFQWVLLPGILFLMVSILSGTRWRALKAAPLVIGALLISFPEARANQATDAKDALDGKRFKEARESYRKLAEKTRFKDEAARYRIGEGLAAYRSGEYREARGAFSGAMISDDSAISSAAHFGMGNTLFQLGWQGLADQSYPTEPGEVPDLARFETLVKERLARMKQSEEESVGRSEEYRRMDSLMVNWADSVRHYDSATKLNPSDKGSAQNRETTMIYLRKLRELLQEEKKQADQEMPQMGQGKGGQPNEGEGQPGEDNGGGNGENDQEGGGEGDKKDKDGSGGDQKKEDEKGKNNGGDPNETAEERARRLLEDNADLEKGPMGQGRFNQRAPKKDW
ncbi:MAG TPA: VWA domain-containing protein [Luteolibacter sp.]|nr:VWA domain-containing protein [Luteolibacter sp.]